VKEIKIFLLLDSTFSIMELIKVELAYLI